MLDASTSSSTFSRDYPTQTLGLSDLIEVLWRRKWYLVGSITVSLALGIVYLIYAPPTYSVASRVLVQPEGSPLADQNSLRPQSEFLATQGEIISSPAVVRRAVDSMEKSLSIDPATDPVLAIQDNLRVKPLPGTNVLSLTYQCQDSVEGISLVAAILDSYRQFSQQRSADTRLEALDLLTRNEQRLRSELEDREQDYRELRKQSPLIGQGTSATNFQTVLLEQLGQSLNNVRNRRIDFQNRMELSKESSDTRLTTEQRQFNATTAVFRVPVDNEFVQPVDSATASATFVSAEDSLSHDGMALTLVADIELPGAPDSTRIFQELYLAEERHNELSLNFGPDHPSIKAAKAEIASWNVRLRSLNETASVALEREVAAALRHEKQLVELFSREQEKVKANDDFLIIEKQELDGIERLKTTHNSLLVQLNNLRLLQPDENGILLTRMTILEAPTIGTGPIWPKPSVMLILCCLLGMLGGVAIIAVLERHVRVLGGNTDTGNNRHEQNSLENWTVPRSNGKCSSVAATIEN